MSKTTVRDATAAAAAMDDSCSIGVVFGAVVAIVLIMAECVAVVAMMRVVVVVVAAIVGSWAAVSIGSWRMGFIRATVAGFVGGTAVGHTSAVDVHTLTTFVMQKAPAELHKAIEGGGTTGLDQSGWWRQSLAQLKRAAPLQTYSSIS